jgi:hypothetical protein
LEEHRKHVDELETALSRLDASSKELDQATKDLGE